jgi:preprotein translocase subunit Sec63
MVFGDIFKNKQDETEQDSKKKISIISKCRVCGESTKFTLISSTSTKDSRGKEMQTEVWSIAMHEYKGKQCRTSNQQFKREYVEGSIGLKEAKVKQARQKQAKTNSEQKQTKQRQTKEQVRQEQARQEQARQEQARQEQARQEQARQEQARQEQARQETTEKSTLTLKECYKILEVDETATPEDIHKSYKRLSLQWHPDKHTYQSRKKIAEEEMKIINMAKKELENAGKM